MITLSIKNGNAKLRGKIGTTVDVSIIMNNENFAEGVQNYLRTEANIFKDIMAIEIDKLNALKAAGVELQSVTKVTCKECGK